MRVKGFKHVNSLEISLTFLLLFIMIIGGSESTEKLFKERRKDQSFHRLVRIE